MAQARSANVSAWVKPGEFAFTAEFHFKSDPVILERDAQTGFITLSEKPVAPVARKNFDGEAEGSDCKLERDMAPMVDCELF